MIEICPLSIKGMPVAQDREKADSIAASARKPSHSDAYRNREIAQYTRSAAIMKLVTFAYLEKRSLNIEPNSAQHSVNANPINASKSAKKISVSHSP